MAEASSPKIDKVRSFLKSQEDKIIVYLFDRAHYAKNDIIYQPGGIDTGNHEISYFDFMHRLSEELQAKAGRFQTAGEIPFFDDLPEPIARRERTEYPGGPSSINVNDRIMQMYMDRLDGLFRAGNDGEYGFSVDADIHILDALSSRIHNGIVVADVKYHENSELYNNLAEKCRRDGILNKLTVPEKETEILERVERKGLKHGINPEFIVSFYREDIIPLTKEVEVERIFERFRMQ